MVSLLTHICISRPHWVKPIVQHHICKISYTDTKIFYKCQNWSITEPLLPASVRLWPRPGSIMAYLQFTIFFIFNTQWYLFWCYSHELTNHYFYISTLEEWAVDHMLNALHLSNHTWQVVTLETCQNVPVLNQNWNDAVGIVSILIQYWHILACLLGIIRHMRLSLLVLKLEYSQQTRSIPELLMPWFLASPGHQ